MISYHIYDDMFPVFQTHKKNTAVVPCCVVHCGMTLTVSGNGAKLCGQIAGSQLLVISSAAVRSDLWHAAAVHGTLGCVVHSCSSAGRAVRVIPSLEAVALEGVVIVVVMAAEAVAAAAREEAEEEEVIPALAAGSSSSSSSARGSSREGGDTSSVAAAAAVAVRVRCTNQPAAAAAPLQPPPPPVRTNYKKCGCVLCLVAAVLVVRLLKGQSAVVPILMEIAAASLNAYRTK